MTWLNALWAAAFAIVAAALLLAFYILTEGWADRWPGEEPPSVFGLVLLAGILLAAAGCAYEVMASFL
jgi:hypothetical protein